jgi:hypothetical protein
MTDWRGWIGNSCAKPFFAVGKTPFFLLKQDDVKPRLFPAGFRYTDGDGSFLPDCIQTTHFCAAAKTAFKKALFLFT